MLNVHHNITKSQIKLSHCLLSNRKPAGRLTKIKLIANQLIDQAGCDL